MPEKTEHNHVVTFRTLAHRIRNKQARFIIPYAPTSRLQPTDAHMHSSACFSSRLCLGAARGLAYMHDRLLVHGDIKPENIVVSDDLRSVKLIDFGSTGSEYSPILKRSVSYMLSLRDIKHCSFWALPARETTTAWTLRPRPKPRLAWSIQEFSRSSQFLESKDLHERTSVGVGIASGATIFLLQPD